jgi:hypothetical protein
MRLTGKGFDLPVLTSAQKPTVIIEKEQGPHSTPESSIKQVPRTKRKQKKKRKDKWELLRNLTC